MSNNFEVYADKAKLILGAAVFSAGGLYALHGVFMKPAGPVPIKYSFIFTDSHQLLIFVLALLTPVLFMCMKALLNSNPVIVISPEGVLDRRHFKSVIPWSGIEGIGFDSMSMGLNNFDLWVLELTPPQSAQTKFTLIHHLNKYFYSTGNENVICVHLNGLETDFHSLEEAVNIQRARRPMQNYGRYGQGKRAFGRA